MPSVTVHTLLFKQNIDQEVAAIAFARELKRQHDSGHYSDFRGLCEKTMGLPTGWAGAMWGEDGKKTLVLGLSLVTAPM